MLRDIKTESLFKELMDRCSDQMADPEPQHDDVLSYLTMDELDWLMGELIAGLHKRNERAKGYR